MARKTVSGGGGSPMSPNRRAFEKARAIGAQRKPFAKPKAPARPMRKPR